MSTFTTTKAVQVSAKNLTAAIVRQSATAAPYLRFAFDTTSDFGASSTGKMHSVSSATNSALDDSAAGIRVSFTAYRKATLANKDITALVKESAGGAAADAATFGVTLPAKSGRGFVARGNAADGSIYVDIPSVTIATLSNPHTTCKERDAVAPPSSKGNKRLLCSSAGFSNVLNGAVGLSFNIMMDIEATLNRETFSKALGVAPDDQLFTDLCSMMADPNTAGTSAAAAAAATATGGAGAPQLSRFSAAVRDYLATLSSGEVTSAVRSVFAAKLKIAAVDAPNTTAMDVISKVKVDAARTWVIASLVETAMNKVRIDHMIAGGDVAELVGAMPQSNAELIDLFESSPSNDAVKATVKACLVAELQRIAEGGSLTPETKKRRSE